MTALLPYQRDSLKRAAAAWAIAEIEDGMVVGLGSGTTAAFAIEALAVRIAKGLRVLGLPTSNKSAALARQLGVPLTDFAKHRRLDVVIDGADQIALATFDLIKGGGGSLLREKIVASACDRMIVIVDETKLAGGLGGDTLLPVEIVSFGWQTVFDRLASIGCGPQLRLVDGKPFTTDGGNYIADCRVALIPDPAGLEAQLSAIVGVIESGLFIGMASDIVVGRGMGVDVFKK
jgi:ribose 5-phosphate isomerase A